MSNVHEAVNLYLTDKEVSDAQFRAVIVDARARDMINGHDDGDVRELLDNHGRSLVLLNRIDDLRRDQIADLDKALTKLTGFCDSLAGQLRVLRERVEGQ